MLKRVPCGSSSAWGAKGWGRVGERYHGWRRATVAVISLPGLLPLVACANFFVPPTSTTGSTGTPTPSNTGDYAYVANSVAGITYLSEYSVASGKLNSLGTIQLGYIPVAMAVAPSNSFLYVASAPGAANPGVYGYAIGSTGTLSGGSNTPLVTDTVAAMAISPDGNWLFTVDSDGLILNEYEVTPSSGALKLITDVSLIGTPCNLTAAAPVSQSCSIAVAPGGAYVVASLGVSGDLVLGYNSTNGLTGSVQSISSGYSVGDPTGDFSVALDANNYAYIAQTNSVTVYGIGSLTSILNEGTLPYAAGSAPRGITLSRNGHNLYTANEAAGTISGLGIGNNGTLSTLSGSPFAGPANVSALAADNTGDYMVAVGYDAQAGVRLYSVASTGVLTQVDAAGSGTNEAYPALVAMTH